MNREIRFRAWDGKEMFEVRSIDFSSKNIPISVRPVIGKMSSEGDVDFDFPLWDAATITLMQFTGLLDKNGKEIYEGDIVEAWIVGTVDERPHIERLVVVFKQGCFCVENTGRSILLSNICRERPLNKYYECCLIGNIYENPDLFKTDAAGTQIKQ